MFSTFIHNLTRVSKWLALITMASMMFFTAIGVISRTFFTPILGDIELIQLGMVILIMFGLSHTENVGGHISIGLIVDRLPEKVQLSLDVMGRFLNVVVTLYIAYVFVQVAINHLTNMQLTTDLLNIPFYPFDFIIAIGFTLWGLEVILKLSESLMKLLRA